MATRSPGRTPCSYSHEASRLGAVVELAPRDGAVAADDRRPIGNFAAPRAVHTAREVPAAVAGSSILARRRLGEAPARRLPWRDQRIRRLHRPVPVRTCPADGGRSSRSARGRRGGAVDRRRVARGGLGHRSTIPTATEALELLLDRMVKAAIERARARSSTPTTCATRLESDGHPPPIGGAVFLAARGPVAPLAQGREPRRAARGRGQDRRRRRELVPARRVRARAAGVTRGAPACARPGFLSTRASCSDHGERVPDPAAPASTSPRGARARPRNSRRCGAGA